MGQNEKHARGIANIGYNPNEINTVNEFLRKVGDVIEQNGLEEEL